MTFVIIYAWPSDLVLANAIWLILVREHDMNLLNPSMIDTGQDDKSKGSTECPDFNFFNFIYQSFDFTYQSFDFIYQSFDFIYQSFDFIYQSFDFIYQSFDFIYQSFDFIYQSFD